MSSVTSANTAPILNPNIQNPAAAQAPSLKMKAAGFLIGESIGMAGNYVKGYALAWTLGGISSGISSIASYVFNVSSSNAAPQSPMLNPGNTGALMALGLPANQIAYPFFHKLFMCKADTPIRNSVVNQIAHISSQAMATVSAKQLGYNINPMEVVNMNLVGLFIGNVIKMSNMPAEQALKSLPELISSVALTALFSYGAKQYGYEIDPIKVLGAQIYNIAIFMLLAKTLQGLNSLTREDDQTTQPIPQRQPVDEVIVESEG